MNSVGSRGLDDSSSARWTSSSVIDSASSSGPMGLSGRVLHGQVG